MTVYPNGQSHTAGHPPDRSTVLSMALSAAEDGRAVFPLHHKTPAIPKREGGRGYKDASRDPARTTAMFNRAGRSATGYGIATGQRSGRIVADIDGPEGVEAALRMGLRSEYVVRTGREREGWHLYFEAPEGVEISSFELAEGIEVKAEGSYVVGPGSLHPSGRTYRVVRDGTPDVLPEFILEAALATGAKERSAKHREPSGSLPPVSIEVAGPEIPDGSRNRTLARIAGRLHDGTRGLEQLAADLLEINRVRCTPPLDEVEVGKIAESIFGRPPCTPRGAVTPRVRATVRYLKEVADERPVRGMAGASGWSIYHAGLEACEEFGREHPEGVALSLDTRSWAQRAGTEASTVSRWLWRTPGSLVRVLKRGAGRRATTVLFVVPEEARSQIGVYLQHSSTFGDSQENKLGSVATDPLLRTLYRSRWSKRAHKPKRGLVAGTRMVRQGAKTKGSDGIKRMGPSQAALLWKISQHPGASRAELAAMLGVKPDSLKKRLRSLLDAGMIVRTSRGHYAPAPELERRLEDARELAKEPEDDRLQIARHGRERDAYHRHHEAKPPEARPSASEAGIANVKASREKRAAYFSARKPEEPKPRTRDPEQERRVAHLVREGMKRKFAEEDVYGAPEAAPVATGVPTGRKLPPKVGGVYVHGQECDCWLCSDDLGEPLAEEGVA